MTKVQEQINLLVAKYHLELEQLVALAEKEQMEKDYDECLKIVKNGGKDD
jgi:hypothetical protein